MRTDKCGFTLIELLVVISILALLTGMVVPILHGVWAIVNGSATEAQMGSLAMAIRQYGEGGMFHTFPPSNKDLVAACKNNNVVIGDSYADSGAEALHFFLRGWYVNDDDEVIRGEGYRIAELGGRTRSVKSMYEFSKGETISAADPIYGFGGAADGKFFADKFEKKRPILYFKAISNGSGLPYTEAHNSLPLEKWKPDADDVVAFDDVIKPGGTLRSMDFILWSAGHDGLFMSDDDIIRSP